MTLLSTQFNAVQRLICIETPRSLINASPLFHMRLFLVAWRSSGKDVRPDMWTCLTISEFPAFYFLITRERTRTQSQPAPGEP